MIIAREFEMGRRLRRVIVHAEAQVLVGTIGIDHLARVYLPVRISDRLELAKGLYELGPEHLAGVGAPSKNS